MLKRLAADARSAAGLEFAIVAPLLVIMLFGVFEVCNAGIIYEEVQNAAHSIPASASNLAVQSSTGATSLTYQQIDLIASEIWAEIPELRTGLENGTASVTISSITFIQTLPPTPPTAQSVKPPGATCNPNKTGPVLCSYTATVAWSVAYTGGASGRTNFAVPALRSCTGAPNAGSQTNATVYYTSPGGTSSYVVLAGGLSNLAPQSSGIPTSTVATWAPSDLTALPTYAVAAPDPILAAPSPILVVDVHVNYLPILGLFLQNGINFYGTGLFPVRSVQAASVGSTGSTALTLSQQFTTIVDDATNGPNGVIPGPPTSTYCVNTGHGLTPAAYSVPSS